jgi:antitoxin MazE
MELQLQALATTKRSDQARFERAHRTSYPFSRLTFQYTKPQLEPLYSTPVLTGLSSSAGVQLTLQALPVAARKDVTFWRRSSPLFGGCGLRPQQGRETSSGRSRCIPKLVYSAYSPGAAMQTRVQKWGNSLGVRIPRGLAEEVGLGAGTEVSLTAKDGELVVKPALPTRLILDELLSGVSESNIHSFVDTGSAVGAEIF